MKFVVSWLERRTSPRIASVIVGALIGVIASACLVLIISLLVAGGLMAVMMIVNVAPFVVALLFVSIVSGVLYDLSRAKKAKSSQKDVEVEEWI